jgi:hypothetical protein
MRPHNGHTASGSIICAYGSFEKISVDNAIIKMKQFLVCICTSLYQPMTPTTGAIMLSIGRIITRLRPKSQKSPRRKYLPITTGQTVAVAVHVLKQ